MNKIQKLNLNNNAQKVILGVGPMSWNCIDAVIEVANEQKIPIQLIASRRQVECAMMGGGYVTTTEILANYVRQKDDGGFVYLARDHGGPWKGINEEGLSHKEAMRKAKQSYLADIENGFDVIHIDPSSKNRKFEDIMQDIVSLHAFCEKQSKIYKKQDVLYECGTEEHSGQITDPKIFKNFVKRVKNLRGMQFVVGNMGYWVKELENVGIFDEKNAKNFVKTCNKYNLYLKGHNSDYITDLQLQKYVEFGVHSINIAPEFGTLETSAIIYQLTINKRKELVKNFINIAVKSNKWKKWMKSNVCNFNLHKAVICGHYIFNTPEFKRIKEDGKINDNEIKRILKIDIINKLRNLGWKII